MKLTKCEQCGGPTAEGLPLCPDCMRATGAAAETCRGEQSSEPLKSSIACLWKNLWTVWITGNAC